jgi:hypothetical protein
VAGYKESKKDKRRRAKEKRHAAQKAEKRKDIERELQKISSIPSTSSFCQYHETRDEH